MNVQGDANIGGTLSVVGIATLSNVDLTTTTFKPLHNGSPVEAEFTDVFIGGDNRYSVANQIGQVLSMQ